MIENMLLGKSVEKPSSTPVAQKYARLALRSQKMQSTAS